jgi:hypothetical protein
VRARRLPRAHRAARLQPGRRYHRTLFIEQTGYNACADANGIIVLYPQAKGSPFLPF